MMVSRRIFFSGDEPEECPECGLALGWESGTAEDAYSQLAEDIYEERFGSWWDKKGSVRHPLRARFKRAVPRLARFLAFVDRRNGVVHE